MGRKYTVPWYSAAKTTGGDTTGDLIQITSASTKVIKIAAIHVEQHTDYGDAQAEGIRLQLARFTTGGGGGTAITPTPLSPGDAAAAGTYAGGSEATALTAAATLTPVIEGGMNLQSGWHWTPPPGYEWEIAPSAKMVLKIKLPATLADAVDFEITLEVEELG
jgi:hypothetical protein